MLYHGGRVMGVPWYAWKGGRRVLGLTTRRVIYTPKYQISRQKTPAGCFVDTYKPFPCGDICEKRDWEYTRFLPHVQPPPSATKTVYYKERVIVPPGQVAGVNGGFFQPGIASNFFGYQVPFGWRFELKKFLVQVLDTDFDTLFAVVLHNGYEAFQLEAARRLPADSNANFGGAGYELLPNWPQDQFNNELRFGELDWVGYRAVNNTFAEREVNIAFWGWKYPEKCEDLALGVR